MTTETRDFTMDPNLLLSVIKSQAGTLSKALLEGTMNSIDAGATQVDIEITQEKFIIRDNGRGFTTAEEIEQWFGRFGTPHVEGDAVFGRFRMGRGQMMAYASTVWKSGPFCMKVDIERTGLTYELSKLEEPVKGCIIEGTLYAKLREYQLTDTLTELKRLIAYAPKPVHVNGKLFGASAARLKTWDFEDGDAYYKIVQDDSAGLAVYNLGVFVEQVSAWRKGVSGIVVSKKALEVNFARNSVMEDKCTVWKRICDTIQDIVFKKLAQAKKLSDGERQFLAQHLSTLKEKCYGDWLGVKLLTDPSGKHVALRDLKKFRNFVLVQEAGPMACAAHGEDGTFVVTQSMLSRFGVSTVSDMLEMLHKADATILHPDHEIIEISKLAKLGLGGLEEIKSGNLAKREMAAFLALNVLNHKLGEKLVETGIVNVVRPLLVGTTTKGKSAIAWTDGRTYITANRKYLKRFEKGLDGVQDWLMTLVHEYMHDQDDSESHSHGEEFYRKTHDVLMEASAINLGALTQFGLAEYLRQIGLVGLPKSRKLLAQLSKSSLKHARSKTLSDSSKATLS